MDNLHSKAVEIATRVKELGGRALIVGGYVRDNILGLNPKDLDLEVYGIPSEVLATNLKDFGKLDLVGESFQVYKLSFDSEGERFELDISIPRIDKKVGEGHKAFEVTGNPNATVEDAARRRDFTINSISQDVLTNELIDPFNGVNDLNNGVLRATDSKHFGEDALRVLRGMQFAARFNMTVEPLTASLCDSISNEFSLLAKERLSTEFIKLVEKGNHPSKALDFLVDTNWVKLFPEINTLIGVPQDSQWHPEGDVFTHTKFVMDAAANIATREGLNNEDRTVLVLAALCHDFAKPICTRVEWKASVNRDAIISPGHEEAGGPLTESFLNSIGINKSIIEKVKPLVENHLKHMDFVNGGTARAIRRLSNRLNPTNVTMLSWLIEADHSGRPPLAKCMPEAAKQMLIMADIHKVSDKPLEKLLKGRHLIEMGLKPSPKFGEIINSIFEMQLDGKINTLDEAIKEAKKMI